MIYALLWGAILALQVQAQTSRGYQELASQAFAAEALASDRGADASNTRDQSLATADDGAPLAATLLAAVNRARAAAALAPLRAHVRLDELALDWSRHLAAAGALSHRDPIAQRQWIEDQVTGHWGAHAESVAQGGSVAELLDTLLASAPHRAQLLGSFDLVGVGVTIDPHGVLWATLNFVDLN